MNQITGWKDDIKFLNATAVLTFQDPEELWEDLCEQTGEKMTYRQAKRNKQFPFPIRNELRMIYNKRIKEEEYIAQRCIEESKKIIKIVPYIILVFMAVLTMVSF